MAPLDGRCARRGRRTQRADARYVNGNGIGKGNSNSNRGSKYVRACAQGPPSPARLRNERTASASASSSSWLSSSLLASSPGAGFFEARPEPESKSRQPAGQGRVPRVQPSSSSRALLSRSPSPFCSECHQDPALGLIIIISIRVIFLLLF